MNFAQSRKKAVLSESVHQRLNKYVLAASAAGVGMLASSPTAEGKIIYTPANVNLQGGQPLPVDLNHDGKVDFYLLLKGSIGQSGFGVNYLAVCHKPFEQIDKGYICASSTFATNNMNEVQAITATNQWAAAALPSGAKIQNRDRFLGKDVAVGMGAAIFPTYTSGRTQWVGPWVNGGKGIKRRYLGLKFEINDRFHLGWARLTVTTQKRGLSGRLSGYAYETVANKPIVAGKTQGQDVITSIPEFAPSTLGKLALGRR